MVPVEGGGLAGTVSIVGRGKTLRLLQEETHGAAYEWTFRYCWYCMARLSKCSGRRSGPGCILDRKLKSGGGDRAERAVAAEVGRSRWESWSCDQAMEYCRPSGRAGHIEGWLRLYQ